MPDVGQFLRGADSEVLLRRRRRKRGPTKDERDGRAAGSARPLPSVVAGRAGDGPAPEDEGKLEIGRTKTDWAAHMTPQWNHMCRGVQYGGPEAGDLLTVEVSEETDRSEGRCLGGRCVSQRSLRRACCLTTLLGGGVCRLFRWQRQRSLTHHSCAEGSLQEATACTI